MTPFNLQFVDNTEHKQYNNPCDFPQDLEV